MKETDRRRSKTFCEHCNSKIEKHENHLPVTKEVNGKISKYCEIRINRKKNV